MSTTKSQTRKPTNLKRKTPTPTAATEQISPEIKRLNGYFWNLTSNNTEKRIEGAKSIILSIKQAQQSVKPGTKSTALNHVFPRLIEGLGSNRPATQEGSAMALTQLLSSISEASLPTRMLLDALPTDPKSSLVRVLGILCGVRGGRNLVSEKVLSDLISAASASNRQREIAVEAIMGMIDKDVSGESVKRIFSPLITSMLNKNDVLIPEIVAAALSLERRGLLPEIDGKLLDSNNFEIVGSCLAIPSVNTYTNKLHVLWQTVINYIYDPKILGSKMHCEWLKNVWNVAEKVASENKNPKILAGAIIPKLIEFIGDRIVAADIEILFSETSLKTLFTLNRKTDSTVKTLIHSLIQKLTKLDSTKKEKESAKKESTSNIFHSMSYLIYAKFIKYGQYTLFNKTFYPKILNKFITNFTPFDCSGYIEKLYKMFAADKSEVTLPSSSSSSKELSQSHKRALRVWAAEQLSIAASVHPSAAPEVTLEALRFLFRNAHFCTETQKFGVKERKFHATQFASLLARLVMKSIRGVIQKEERESGGDKVDEENERYWSVELLKYACELISGNESENNGKKNKKKSVVKYQLYLEDEIDTDLIQKVMKKVSVLIKNGKESDNAENKKIVKSFVTFLSSMALVLGFPVVKVVKDSSDDDVDNDDNEDDKDKESKKDKDGDEEMKDKKKEDEEEEEDSDDDDDDDESDIRKAEREEINDLINDILECSNVISNLGKPVEESSSSSSKSPKKKSKKSSNKKSEDEDDGNKDEVSKAMDVLLDVILSILSRPSKVLRKCAEICFLDVSPYLTKDCLVTLTEALTSQQSLEKIEDNNDEDDENMDDDDDDDDDDSGAEDMDVDDDDDDDEDEDAEEEDLKFDDNDDDDDIDIDEDYMDSHEKELKEFDKKLAKMFREKNDKKILQIEQTYFKIKVAYLISEYIQKSKKSGHTEHLLSLLEPLYNSLLAASAGESDSSGSSSNGNNAPRRDASGSKQLASRIHRVLKTLLEVKGLRVNPSDNAAELNQLFISMVQGTRSKIPLVVRVSLETSLFLAKALCQSKPSTVDSGEISQRIRKEPALESVYSANKDGEALFKLLFGKDATATCAIGRMDANACYNLHVTLYDILVDKRAIVADFFRRLADKVPTLFWSLIPHILSQIPQLKKRYRMQYAYELVEKAFITAPSLITVVSTAAAANPNITRKQIGDCIAKLLVSAVKSTLEKLDKNNFPKYVQVTRQMYKAVTAFVHFLGAKQQQQQQQQNGDVRQMTSDDVRDIMAGESVVELIDTKFTEESGFKKSALFLASCIRRAFAVGSVDENAEDPQKGNMTSSSGSSNSSAQPKQSRRKQKQMARLQAYLERVKAAAAGATGAPNAETSAAGAAPAAKKQKVSGGDHKGKPTAAASAETTKRSTEVRKAKKKFAARRSHELRQ